MDVKNVVESLFPIEFERVELTCQKVWVDDHLFATLRLVNWDLSGGEKQLRDVYEQTSTLLSSNELSSGNGEQLLRERAAKISEATLSNESFYKLFYVPDPVAIPDDIKEYLEQFVRVSSIAGYDDLDSAKANLGEMLSYEVPDAPESAFRFWTERLVEAFERRAAEELGWDELTTNDRITAAFEELDTLGIVALENAGYTMSDGWSDIHEMRAQDSWAGVFFHAQDVERGIENDGLMLAYGAFTDENHEEESLRAAKVVCETLEKHGVKTEWGGSLNTRISIEAFAWKKRRLPKPE